MEKLIILPRLNNCSGNIKKQWFVYYSIRNPKSGKMQRIRHYDGFTGLNEEERYIHAEKLIMDYTSKLKSGWTPWNDASNIVYDDHIDYQTINQIYGSRRAGNRTLRFAINKWLEYKKQGISKSSFQTYTSKFRIFTIWTERSGLQLNDISTYSHSLIVLFFNYLINKKQLSGRTVNKYKELLKAFFSYCVDNKYIKNNPVYQIPKCNRINDQTPRPIMRDDIEVFKKELIKDPELWLAIQLEYYCALRPGHEIRELKIKDIDLAAGYIRIDRPRAKNRRERIVTIPRQLLLFIRENYDFKKYDRDHYLFGKGGMPGPVPISKNHLGRRFVDVRRRLHMPSEYTLYSWKHTAAVEVDESLLPLKDLSRHYGHGSISMTDVYLRNKKPGVSQAIRDNYPEL